MSFEYLIKKLESNINKNMTTTIKENAVRSQEKSNWDYFFISFAVVVIVICLTICCWILFSNKSICSLTVKTSRTEMKKTTTINKFKKF